MTCEAAANFTVILVCSSVALEHFLLTLTLSFCLSMRPQLQSALGLAHGVLASVVQIVEIGGVHVIGHVGAGEGAVLKVAQRRVEYANALLQVSLHAVGVVLSSLQANPSPNRVGPFMHT